MAARLWPDLDDKHRWALELMEERLAQTTQRPEALAERARELRAQAARTDIDGYRDAYLALADRLRAGGGRSPRLRVVTPSTALLGSFCPNRVKSTAKRRNFSARRSRRSAALIPHQTAESGRLRASSGSLLSRRRSRVRVPSLPLWRHPSL